MLYVRLTNPSPRLKKVLDESPSKELPMRIDTAAEKETFIDDMSSVKREYLEHVLSRLDDMYKDPCDLRIKQMIIYEAMVIRGYLGDTNA